MLKSFCEYSIRLTRRPVRLAAFGFATGFALSELVARIHPGTSASPWLHGFLVLLGPLLIVLAVAFLSCHFRRRFYRSWRQELEAELGIGSSAPPEQASAMPLDGSSPRHP